jgi:hypothetical protein
MSSSVGSANDCFAASGSSPQIEPDFFVETHGSIFLLRPVTPAAFAWVSEHIPEDAQFFGEAVCVEHRSSFSAAVKAETTASIPVRCNKLMSSGSQSCPLGRRAAIAATPDLAPH